MTTPPPDAAIILYLVSQSIYLTGEQERAIAALIPQADGWKPIEECVIGSEVILYGKLEGELSGVASDPSIAVGTWNGRIGSIDSDYYSMNIHATHFMYLPPPP